MDNFYIFSGIADFSDTQTLLALIIAFFAVVLLIFAKKLAVRYIEKKFPDLKKDDEENKSYAEKLLNVTLVFKGIAAAIAAVACILTII